MFKPEEPLKGTKFSENKEKIIAMIDKNDGYCPCGVFQSEKTKCPCPRYLITLECHCTLYIREE